MTSTVLVVLGTRPEAIKLMPVVHALRAHDRLNVRVCSTGQHRQLLNQLLAIFDVEVDDDLALMQPNQTLAAFTAAAVVGLDSVLRVHRPSLVLVQGDTTTAFSAALAAFYRQTPIAHVEAGLRTGDLQGPWPEEANRVLTTRLADIHFAPTCEARRNLLAEGVPPNRVLVTGNTVVDALMFARKKLAAASGAVPGLPPGTLPASPSQRLVLVTCHRRESFGASLEAICRAIAMLAERFPDVSFVYPVHLNPSVRDAVRKTLGTSTRPNILLLGPVPYLAFVALMERACLILSDSGGVQEEAPTVGTPVLVLREKTERPEALRCGAALLVGTESTQIVAAAERLLMDEDARLRMTLARNPFGDGLAGQRIAEASARFLLGLDLFEGFPQYSQEAPHDP
jgi:UDP-N-acetylglucosamine 2-epimerase (non-hydrolysing)